MNEVLSFGEAYRESFAAFGQSGTYDVGECNGARMCTSAGKAWADYKRLASTKDNLVSLVQYMGCPPFILSGMALTFATSLSRFCESVA
jgi:hypothetical protein